jgi:hypothetical protein
MLEMPAKQSRITDLPRRDLKKSNNTGWGFRGVIKMAEEYLMDYTPYLGKRVHVVTLGNGCSSDGNELKISLEYVGKLVGEYINVIELEDAVLRSEGLLKKVTVDGDIKILVMPSEMIKKDKIISVGLSPSEKKKVSIKGKPVVHLVDHMH